MGLTVFIRRLLGRRPGDESPLLLGRDVGLTGSAANVPLHNRWQATRLEAAPNSRKRFDAAQGYYLTVEVNARRIAEEKGDFEALSMIDEFDDELANSLVERADALREAMLDRG